MNNIEQLQQSIAILESQRAVLGDAVVDTMLAPALEKLAALKAQAAPVEQQRKQVTVLFADVSGFTAMSETLDAEEVTEIMNALWARLDEAITTQGGQIDKHIGDAVMALWGVESAREDDPERAILAALAMQAALAQFRAEHGVQLAMRIGLNTGPVLLGQVGSTHEFTAMGDAVNLASRLEHAAPVGGILISYDAYRQVRGVFDVQAQAPLSVKGKAAPVQTYVVLQAKLRAFRMGTRGVEGIETHMVGRDAELIGLQSAFEDALGGETRLALIVGEAGVGKSRLLYEFEQWIDLHPETIYFFKGRSAPALQNTPYGIWRDLFAYRFEILDTDHPAVVLEKFHAGMAGILPPERADLVGSLAGFDFSASPAVKNLTGSEDFSKLARVYLVQYIRSLAEAQPVVLFLEDLHWADDGSLDLVEYLLDAIPLARLLIVGLTRPTLFERRPHWVEGLRALTRLDLKPLSKRASRELVDDILQKLDVVPDTLRELVVEGAEGNPFYLEELVKMLIDEGVIHRGRVGSPDEHWSVDLELLKQTRVPPTLTGILQARLDGLPKVEREALQRAAVVGRIFWDAAVADLLKVERDTVGGALVALRGRELIYWRERSTFSGAEEFLFKNALMRDAAYETVLMRQRKEYHARVAAWLEAHAGERIGEYAGLIADHLERAGQPEAAARYLYQSAEKALATGAYREALAITRRALTLLAESSPEYPSLQLLNGRALHYLGDYEAARLPLERALSAAAAAGDQSACTIALNFLADLDIELGDFVQARAYLERSLSQARQSGDQAGLSNALYTLAWIDIRQGYYPEARKNMEECQALYEALGNRLGVAKAINVFSILEQLTNNLDESIRLLKTCLTLVQELGARGQEAVIFNNLGNALKEKGDFAQAHRYLVQSLAVSSELGDLGSVATARDNLGHLMVTMEEDDAARAYFHEVIPLAHARGMTPILLDALAGYTILLARAGADEQVLALIGAVTHHPALVAESQLEIEKALKILRARCTETQITDGMARGKNLSLDQVVADIK